MVGTTLVPLRGRLRRGRSLHVADEPLLRIGASSMLVAIGCSS